MTAERAGSPTLGMLLLLALLHFPACGSEGHSAVAPVVGTQLDSGRGSGGSVDAAAPDSSTGQAGSSDIQMIQITVKDFVFDARVAGPESGEVIILLHGFPETGYEWRHQLRALAKHGYRAIAPDQRGYSPGARPPNVADYGVLLLAEDVIGMADSLRVDRFHLVGHDWGGGVGWAVAGLHPDRVLTYTAVSTPHPDAFEEKLADPTSCQYGDSAYFDTFQSPDATNAFLANDAGGLRSAYAWQSPEDVAVYLTTLGNRPAMDAALDWYRANIKDRLFTTPTLGKVTAPTRLVFGEFDSYFCLDTAKASADFVSGPYRFIEVPGVDHWVPETSPEDVTNAILDVIRAARDGG